MYLNETDFRLPNRARETIYQSMSKNITPEYDCEASPPGLMPYLTEDHRSHRHWRTMQSTHGQSSRELDRRKYMELFTCWARSRDREKVVITVSLSPLPSVSEINRGKTNGWSSAGSISTPDFHKCCHASTCSSKRLLRFVRASSNRLIASRVIAIWSIASGPKSILLAKVEIYCTVDESSIVCKAIWGCWVQMVT